MDMEAILWLLGLLFSVVGAIMTIARHPRWPNKMVGLLPVVLFAVAMLGVYHSVHDIDHLTRLYWAVFYVALPSFAGVSGYFLARNADAARQAAIYERIVSQAGLRQGSLSGQAPASMLVSP
jgi:hypothetical protein